MKRIYIVAFLMLLCTTADAQIMAKLKEIGMENIRCVQTPETTTVAFENNVYRGTYTGIGKAVTACLDGIPGGNLQMVVLETESPVYISICRTHWYMPTKKETSALRKYTNGCGYPLMQTTP